MMLAENIFPPIPSELIMPLAGFVAAKGQLNPVLVVLAGTLGSLLGALPWYYAGVWLGQERVCALAARHGRWLTLGEKEIRQAIRWFERHGRIAVLIGRLVPTVRTLISLPAGMARMPLLPFLVYSVDRHAGMDRGARPPPVTCWNPNTSGSAAMSTTSPRPSSA